MHKASSKESGNKKVYIAYYYGPCMFTKFHNYYYYFNFRIGTGKEMSKRYNKILFLVSIKIKFQNNSLFIN